MLLRIPYILENASPLLFTHHLVDFVVIKKVKSREEIVALTLPPEQYQQQTVLEDRALRRYLGDTMIEDKQATGK